MSNNFLLKKKIIIAIDFSDILLAKKIIDFLDPKIYRLKIGKESFIRFGTEFIIYLHKLGFDVFLDLKFHDIPNTVAKAVSAVADIGVWMISVHCMGGENMLKSAKLALLPFKKDAPLLIGVTILTSISHKQLFKLGIHKSCKKYVLFLAKMAEKCGLDGVICAGEDIKNIKKKIGNKFKIITPGIRLNKDENLHDQYRTMTPMKAFKLGSDYIVIGRTITKSKNPIDRLQSLILSI
ncbi:orotidine-5'-phosphate decarboxylase [Buchnera aphidicola (Taiwanaphis decaspermi)]|uniref:orotidine-5'-phosphate decarboxylase n=1 Tax=Buchnera aphidicola TaxID=9 RepID=UPI0031B85425